jgi:hypothetical protein
MKLEKARQLQEARQAKEEARLQKQAKKQLVSKSKSPRIPRRSSPKKSVRFEPYQRPIITVQGGEAEELSRSSSRPHRRLPQCYRS